MTDNFERHVKEVVQTFSSSSTKLQASAQKMTKTAELTSQQSSSVASAAEQATTNVQTVASAVEELSSSIAEISSQVSKSSEIAQNAVSEADRTNTTVEGLAEAAQKIGDVVSLINDIAGQTNLLALNATIEAARAGDAGKGFAVVASEVKNLANQTAKATEEIGNQIGAIQGATGEAVTAIKGIGGTIPRDQRDRLLDRVRRRGTGRRHLRDQPQRPGGRHRHPGGDRHDCPSGHGRQRNRTICRSGSGGIRRTLEAIGASWQRSRQVPRRDEKDLTPPFAG